MAKVLSNNGIITGQPVEAAHVSQSVNALTAAEAYDIFISGSLTVNNILYPIVDGTNGQVLTTDGAGSASFQDATAITASYITSSGVDGPFGRNSIVSASYAVSSSRSELAQRASSSLFATRAGSTVTADTASLALTASRMTASGIFGPLGTSSVDNALTASYITSSNVYGPLGSNSILSASNAITAAFALNAAGTDTSSFVITSSIVGQTQSFTRGDGSTYENYIDTASYVITASYAVTASYIETAEAYTQDFVTSSTVTVNHDLGTDDLLIQVYRQSSSADNPIMIIPDQIELTGDNTAVITFPVSESGYVVVTDGGGLATSVDSASFAVTAAYAQNADGVDQAVYTSSITGLTQSFTLGSGATYENYIVSSSYAITASYVELNLTENFRGNFTNVTTFTVTHAFDTEDILIQVYESSSLVTPPRQIQPATVTLDNLNQATVTFAAPTTGFVVINKNSGYISSGSTDFAQTASYVRATQRNLQDGDGILDFYFDGSTDALVTLDTASARFRNATIDTASLALRAQQADTASYFQGFVESASYAERSLKTKEVRLPIFNDDNRAIRLGDPVYVEEYDGTNYLVRRADAADASRMPAFGLAMQDLAIGAVGEALVVGEFKGVNTFGLPVGRNIYVASGSGWSSTVPAGPAQTQPLGVIAEESAIRGRFIINGPVADIAIGGGSATTASYVSSSNVDGPLGMDSIRSASFALTASYIDIAETLKAEFTNQTVFIATHGFNSENLNVDVYQDDASTGNIPVQIQPTSVRQINLNQVELTFAAPTTGFAVISKGGFLRLGTVENAQSSSYTNRVENNLVDGDGIVDFTFNGSAPAVVTIDTASARFLNSTVLSSSYATSASYSITASYIEGKVESASYAEFATRAKSTEDVSLPALNDDTASIAKGFPVYIEEHDGLFYRVRLADAANPAKMPAVGVVLSDLGVGETGSVLIAGDVDGINTFGNTAGRNVYVAPGGGWTQTIPGVPNQVQPIGVVGEESPTLGRLVINGPVSDITVGSADTASYVSSSRVFGPFGFDSIQTASYAVTASYIEGTFTERFDFVNQITVPVTHTLNTENVIVQVYEQVGADFQLIQPTSITVVDPANVNVIMAGPTTGYVVITRGGIVQSGLVDTARTASFVPNTYKQNVAGGLTYAITHNLGEEFPIVQAYDTITRAQEIPASVVSAGPQAVTVTFAVIFNGTIIVKK